MPSEFSELQKIAKEIRREVLKVVYNSKTPHIGSAFSVVEILVALYFRYLKISPELCLDNNRDRFILSKGHASAALYAVLARKGFITNEMFNQYSCNGGSLEEHPNLDVSKGIECTTGSLGHGLSVSVGMALAGKRDNKNYKVCALLSDGETQSGFVWEAAMFAAHHELDNLVAIIDYNKIQALGMVKDVLQLEPYEEKWKSFGWGTAVVDGHNFDELLSALSKIRFKEKKPNVIIANTIKGKGVSFMENQLLWHYRTPDEKELATALAELQ